MNADELCKGIVSQISEQMVKDTLPSVVETLLGDDVGSDTYIAAYRTLGAGIAVCLRCGGKLTLQWKDPGETHVFNGADLS